MTYHLFPSFTFVLFLYRGGTLNLVNTVVGQDYICRLFHCLNWLPDMLNWRDDVFIWEDKVVNFCSIPEMQKGLRTAQPAKSKFTLEIKGDFSWGFADKKDVNIGECITLKDIDVKAR